MTCAAVIENGIVTNVIVAELAFAASIGAIPCDDSVAIGWSYDEESESFIAPASPEVDLGEVKLGLKSAVDAAAEFERHKYITPGSGQAMTYQAKASEAVLYSRVGGDEADYPILSSEIGITGENLRTVAELVLSMHNQWLFVGSQIEAVRLAAKAEIDAAGTEEEARAVNPVWP